MKSQIVEVEINNFIIFYKNCLKIKNYLTKYYYSLGEHVILHIFYIYTNYIYKWLKEIPTIV